MKNIIRKISITLSLVIVLLNLSCIAYGKTNEATLVFSKNNGDLILVPNEEFFMNEENMVPGAKYHYDLFIENKNSETYKLYFKVRAKNKSEDAKELLNNINMKVTYDDGTIYQGQANGKMVDKDNSLEKYFSLGTYTPKRKTKIHIDLEVSNKLTKNLANVTSYVDWDFHAERAIDNNTGNNDNSTTDTSSSNNGDKNINDTPKTGDDLSLIYVSVGLLISIFLIAILNRKKIAKR
ncbi:LPXTG cell wall anchor domain-containing protein [Clostridium tarantellae]|uniref:LPXTG cell wall anchor domain-containing protein n=1 Tax=Clostridium tarantellae TaxID=39493 RepID=A0A6I1MMX3_9CLOT|nr:LPXTG cell wall anchor domain-containing protein [Clostridium tarantellae]MPQ44310.1 LPXTG cell wall anchor domain-containing protein [Clostridium tarantellae]